MKTTIPQTIWIVIHDYSTEAGSMEHVGSGFYFLSREEAEQYIRERTLWIGAPASSEMRTIQLTRPR